MSKTRKFIVLLFTLLIPVAIFIFLRLFGRNEFDVAVYYTQGVDTVAVDCSFESVPHKVPYFAAMQPDGGQITDEVLQQGLSVVAMLDMPLDKDFARNLFYQYDKIQNVLPKSGRYNILTVMPPGLTGEDSAIVVTQTHRLETGRRLLYQDEEAYGALARCGLLLNTKAGPYQGRMVLVDSLKQIRGYYPVMDADEVDRLVLEMKILFEKK